VFKCYEISSLRYLFLILKENWNLNLKVEMEFESARILRYSLKVENNQRHVHLLNLIIIRFYITRVGYSITVFGNCDV